MLHLSFWINWFFSANYSLVLLATSDPKYIVPALITLVFMILSHYFINLLSKHQ